MDLRRNASLFALGLLAATSACRKDARTNPSATASPQPAAPGAKLTVTSTALTDGKPMPAAYACKDEKHREKSPPLAWTKGPDGTESYAIEMLDLDAPPVPNNWDKEKKNFLHWRVLNVPNTVLAIPESPNGAPPNGGMAISNDFDTGGFGGPCPPMGAPAHRYAITVYALGKRQPINLPIPKAEALAAGTLTITYAR